MSAASSSLPTYYFSESSRLSLSGIQLEEIIDDIRLEEGDIQVPTVQFPQIRVNEIVTDGPFKYYHGYVDAPEDKNSKKFYALKSLKSRDAKLALDWIKETKTLSTLNHKNIRNLHALSRKNLSDCLESDTLELNAASRYFEVVDIIQETLRRRIDTWALNDRSQGGSFLSNLGAGKSNSLGVDQSDALDRVKFIGHEISKGMTYLHSQNVSFGALKPEKIGFDCHGTVKLMSFQQAVSVDQDKDLKKNRFAADIYSFGLLLWELFTLDVPSERRPPLTGVIPSERLRELIKQCWDKDLDKRPNFRRITKRLLEATSECRHNVVAANKKEEIGQEYQQEERPLSFRTMISTRSKSKKSMKSFRVSKVDLTLYLLSDLSDDRKASSSRSCDLTVATNGS